MSVRRILLRVLVVAAFILICFFAVWRIFRVDDRLRFAILDELRPLVGSTLQIEDLSIRLFAIYINNTQLDVSPQNTISIQTTRINISPMTVLFKGIRSPGAIKEIEIIRPQFHFRTGKLVDADSSLSLPDTIKANWSYSPDLIDKLANLTMISRIKISRGQVITGPEKTIIGDKLRGFIEWSSNSTALLDVSGIMPQVPGMILLITGNADLSKKSFFLSCDLSSSDLRECQLNRIVPYLECQGGSIQLTAELSGGEDLIFIGLLCAENLSLSYNFHENPDNKQPPLLLKNGFFDGALFGNNFQFTGNCDLNGLSLPVQGSIDFPEDNGTIPIFSPEWRVSVNHPSLDLSGFYYSPDSSIGSIPQISGIADLLLNLYGDVSAVHGQLRLSSDQVFVDSVAIRDLTANLLLDDGNLSIETLTSKIWGGSVWIDGEISNDLKNNLLSLQYYRKWNTEELGDWSAMIDPYLSLKGELRQTKGKWSGTGDASLFSSTGANLLFGKLNFENGKIKATVKPVDQTGLIEVNINLPVKDEKTGKSGSKGKSEIVWELKGKNPHKALNNVLSGKIIPDEIYEYDLDFNIKGSNLLSGQEYSDLGTGSISWQSADKSRSGIIDGSLKSDATGALILDSKLKISVQEYINGHINKSFLSGPLNLSFKDSLLKIHSFELANDQQPSGSDQQVLFCMGGVNLNTMTPDSLEIILDDFPLIGMLRYYKTDIPEQITGKVGAVILADGDSVSFSGFSKLTGIKDQDYSVAAIGSWVNSALSIQKGSLVLPDGKQVLGISGSFDFKDEHIDSLILTADDLELDDIFATFAPSAKHSWGGRLDARLELNGKLPYPEATLDAHLNGGVLFSEAGYWGNVRIITEGNLYKLTGFDFGHGLYGLVRANGEFNRFTREYEVELTGDKVEIQSLTKALSGNKGPISGSSHFAILFRGEKLSEKDSVVSLHQAAGELTITPGKLGSLGFDNLSAHFRLHEQNWRNPSLEIDSISIDWSESHARIFGTLPLSNLKLGKPKLPDVDSDAIPQIEISGFAYGKFTEWLPRLSNSFSNPQGDGRLDFSVGSALDSPRLTSAKLKLSGGAFKSEAIINKVSSLNLDVQLDSTGQISINQLEGKIDGQWLRVNNRFPDPDDTTETIKFAGYDLGVLQIQTDEEGVWAIIPGLMEKDWGGYISVNGKSGNGQFEIFGPASQPHARGQLGLRNTTFTFPFIKSSGEELTGFEKEVIDLLLRINWDVTIAPQWDCRYINEISGLKDVPLFETLQKNLSSALFDFDVKLYIDILVDEKNSYLNFNGVVQDTFRLNGDVNSNRGNVEYLDLEFEVQHARLRLNSAEFNPILSGSAATTVIDSSGIPREVRLVVRNSGASNDDANDPLSRSKGGGWGDLSLMLEDDQGHSQEQILAMMGYTPDKLSQKLFDIGGTLVERAVPIRRWTRYLERNIERYLGVDKIDIDPQVAHNLIERQLDNRADSSMIGSQEYNYMMALDNSKVTVGKHISRDIYVSYTAHLQHGVNTENVKRLGMMHYWDLLIQLPGIAPNLNLNYRYQYDGLTELDGHSFRINYRFYLDF